MSLLLIIALFYCVSLVAIPLTLKFSCEPDPYDNVIPEALSEIQTEQINAYQPYVSEESEEFGYALV